MQANLTTEDELRAEGYVPAQVVWRDQTYLHPRFGLMRSFDVIGDVPSTRGVYLFTQGREVVRVRYCGRTRHFWMVTRGQLPGGVARGGNRYGRPR